VVSEICDFAGERRFMLLGITERLEFDEAPGTSRTWPDTEFEVT
jgi:hypothetical protein